MDAWRAAAARRRRDGIRVLTLAVRAENRQRIFYLSKAWSRMVWAASEREAARARQVHAFLRNTRVRDFTHWNEPCHQTSAISRSLG